MRCVWLCLAAHAAAAFDLMSAVLKSPIYKNLLVPASRNMMINTAKENGVPWADAVAWIRSAHKWELDDDADVAVPTYYRQPFHAYEPGNLCWEAAWEAEVAGRAVGARNYPAFGADGEEAFRGAFDDALVAAGARTPGAGDTILDLGCATGHGTRRLAAKFPDAKSLVGVDLSPHMLAVARRLPELCKGEDAAWINVVSDDARVSYARADAASLPFADASQNFVVLSFVAHELPPAATRDVVHEAYRVLRPGGQLWVTEMARFSESEFTCTQSPRRLPAPQDFETEGFRKLRASPAFVFIRSTEPYLDVYADFGAAGVAEACADAGFGRVEAVAATGRHYALVAAKDGGPAAFVDRREATKLPDTHLKTWESKSKS